MTEADNERELLAAEYALGVLEGDEGARAQRLIAEDTAFASLVVAWEERLSPLLDGIEASDPNPEVWDRINAALDRQGDRPSNVIMLEQSVRAWRRFAAAASAVAAALLVVILTRPMLDVQPARPPESAPVPRSVLVANVAAEDRSAAFVVSFNPADRSLLVSPAVAQGDASHDHELWLIPDTGTPVSLGVVSASAPRRLTVEGNLVPALRPEAVLAISVEPVGGSPTGQPTGPVVATGKLIAA